MLLCASDRWPALSALLSRYGLTLQRVADGAPIPGSYWGEPEAGLIGTSVYVRHDTPLHSALHEAAHLVCMDDERRQQLNTDAGGQYAEEDAACYLQIMLAGELGLSTETICADMDAWGYSFRLGSALAWFRQDADEARHWLFRHGLLTTAGKPNGRCRREPAGTDIGQRRGTL